MAKRTNIRRRGKSWVAHLRVNGKQEWKSCKTRDDAELWLAQKRTEKIRGEFRRTERRLFADYAVEWLRDYALGNVKPRTYETYEASIRNHLLPAFGDCALSEIRRKTIDEFVADWKAGGPRYQERQRLALERERTRAKEEDRDPRPVRLGRSAGTISNALTPLREMLGQAVKWEYLTVNPAAGVERPPSERRREETVQTLTAAQVVRLLEKARPESRALLLCAVTTGMRLGELRALRWGDVDWNRADGAVIWVRRNVTNRGVLQEPKTEGSVRPIAMPDTLVRTLRAHRMASPFKADDDLIFASSKGTPLNGTNVLAREFKPALRRAGLPAIRFHDLRHTFASLLIEQGEHPKYISEQLGHASVKITMDRYGHLMPTSYGHAGGRLEKALFGGGAAAAAGPVRPG